MTARRGGAGLSAMVAAGALGVGVLGACGPAADATDRDFLDEASAAPGEAMAASEATAAGDAAAAAEAAAAADSEVPGGLLPGEGPPRRYRLLLGNSLDVPAFVFAAAGVEGVALDTVPARDSARVDVRVRADMVVLEARDSSGVLLDRAQLPMEVDRLNRWEIAGASRVPVTAPAPDSLSL